MCVGGRFVDQISFPGKKLGKCCSFFPVASFFAAAERCETTARDVATRPGRMAGRPGLRRGTGKSRGIMGIWGNGFFK